MTPLAPFRPYSCVEVLESRIAPASLHGHVLTYTDIDGDAVTITVSKGVLTPSMFSFIGIGTHQQLEEIDLGSLTNIGGANITMSVVKASGGDGLASVGRIDAGTNNLGAVTIKGDLGAIGCGSGDAGALALKSLSVDSLGRYGLNTQDGTGNLDCDIEGNLGALNVRGDVTGVKVFAEGIGGMIGAVQIGGSLLADSSGHGGTLESLGNMGPVKIGGDVIGGSATLSGTIDAQGKMASVTIGGSLTGAGQSSGQIFSNGDLGPIRIGGDVTGVGAYSGYIESFGKIASVTIGGSVIGGANLDTGKIAANRDIGAVKIGHNVQAGPAPLSGGLISGLPVGGDYAGSISAGEGASGGNISSITIGGSLIGGNGNDDTFTDAHNVRHGGQIFALGNIGPVRIGGDVRGGSGDYTGSIECSGSMSLISIGGSLIGGAGLNGARLLASVSVGPVQIGHDIQGGANATAAGIGSDGPLASVQVGGSMEGGSINGFAGIGVVEIRGDLEGGFAASTGIISTVGTVGKVTIGGSLIGTNYDDTACISAEGAISEILIGHNFTGGSISGTTGNLVASGYISSAAHLGRVAIGGSILAGQDSSSGGALTLNASIRAGEDIGLLMVKGNVTGTIGSGGDVTPVIISAVGQKAPTSGRDMAIKELVIGGGANRMTVEAGYSTMLAPVNGNAQIGAVSIAGDFVASNLVAGALNYGVNGTNDHGSGDDNLNFGDGNDHIIGGPFVSEIFSVTIGGIAAGTPDSVSDTDHFGIVAHGIGSLKVNGFTIPVPAAPGSANLSPFTGSDVTAVAVS